MLPVQDLVVTAVALGAGAIVLRKVTGFLRPKQNEPGCAHCPSQTAKHAPASDTHPLTFVKSPRR